MSTEHESLMRYFKYEHLKEPLRSVSKSCSLLAEVMLESCEDATDPAEVTVGLRKLLEAKDCFVRSMVK